MLEAISICEEITGNKISYSYLEKNRSGDHIWYISDVSKFKADYPKWNYKYNLQETLIQMFKNMRKRY